jgi:hypothetical protein
MNEYLICVEGCSYISVEAENEEDAKQSARDIFEANHIDSLQMTVLNAQKAGE